MILFLTAIFTLAAPNTIAQPKQTNNKYFKTLQIHKKIVTTSTENEVVYKKMPTKITKITKKSI